MAKEKIVQGAAEGLDLRPIKGYRTTKDVRIATRSSTITILAFRPVTDPRIVAQLKASKIKLEPIYD